MPIIALVQFSGTPNTHQYRLTELFGLASNPEVLREAGSSTSSSLSSSLSSSTTKNHDHPSLPCSCCCCSASSGCEQQSFIGNATSNNVTKIPNLQNHIRVIGGCPTICSIHTLRRKKWCDSSSESENEEEENDPTNSCCRACHMPSFYHQEQKHSPTEKMNMIFTRMFRAFFTNNTSTLFVEFSSFQLMEQIAKRSMMIANFWLVSGIGEDDRIPLPTIKEPRPCLFGKGFEEALQSSLSTLQNTDDNNNQHHHDDEIDKSFISSSHNHNQRQEFRSFLTTHLQKHDSFTYRLEYASAAKYSPDVARHCVESILTKSPVHTSESSPMKQRYDFRTPKTTFMIVVVPPPGLKNPQMLPKEEQERLKQQEKEEVEAEENGSVKIKRRTFYLHTILYETTPRSLLLSLYTLKLRRYIGTTTMVPELSFLLNNAGRVKKGDLVLDPFCGTGSLLLAARHLGAHCIGFDIDGRVMRKGTKDSAQTIQASEFRFREAKKKIPQILASEEGKKFLSAKQLELLREVHDDDENDDKNNADDAAASSSQTNKNTTKKTLFEHNLDQNPQASLKQNFRDMNLGFGPNCFVGSFSAFSKSFGRHNNNHPSVNRPWLDAIITDPPYGIRETKRRTEETFVGSSSSASASCNADASTKRDQTRPLDSHPLYEATELLVDLICFAADSLVEGGRLVFWMSVTSYDYNDRQLPRHPAMELISNIPQQLNVKTVRRLVVMEKMKLSDEQLAEKIGNTEEKKLLLKKSILENTMRGLELRKAYDLDVPSSLEEQEEDASGENNNNNKNDVTTAVVDAEDVNKQEVKKNIEAAQKKRMERQRKFEATQKWRRENLPLPSQQDDDQQQQQQQQQQQADLLLTSKKNQQHQSKAEKRQKNIDNRQKKIDQAARRGREDAEADEEQEISNNNAKPKTPPKPKRNSSKMSRAALYLLGIASLAIIFVFIIFPQSSHVNVDDVHSKHHRDNDKLLVAQSPGERDIDKQDIHVGEDNVAEQHDNDENTIEDKNKIKKKNANKNKNADADEDHNEDNQQQHHDGGENANNQQQQFHHTSTFRSDLARKLVDKQPLLPKKVLELYAGSVMPKSLGVFLKKSSSSSSSSSSPSVTSENGPLSKQQRKCLEWQEKDSPSNTQFAITFSKILREKFPPEKGGALDGSGLHWFLDEGGLIGTSRAGALRNADDDFDFFLLLPNLIAPCRPDSLTCTPDEFNQYIHKFLMVFHNEGMCINKFSPNLKKFKSRGRLMYSFQLNRGNADPENCFIEKKPFAHMHLGIFNEKGEVCTNVWIPPHSTHVKDKLHLDDILPVSRCRAGPVDVPCPQNITGFLSVRNGGEYRRRSSDGSCLIVKKKWGAARKKNAAKTLKALDGCGYNSIIDLLPEFEKSGYKTC